MPSLLCAISFLSLTPPSRPPPYIPRAMASKATRLRVLALYKELHRLGRDYPDPSCVRSFSFRRVSRDADWCVRARYNFHGKLRGLFESELR